MGEAPTIGFWKWAKKTPEREALIFSDGTTIGYGALGKRVNRISHGLRALGLKKGDNVAIVLNNEPAWLETILATLQLGMYLTPINWHLTGPEIAYIVEDSEAKVLIAGGEFAAECTKAAKELSFPAERLFTTGAIAGFRPFAELYENQPDTDPEDRAPGQMMNYTSGTTGRPKGVRRPIGNESPEEGAIATIALLALFGIPLGSGTYLSPGPLYHTAPGAFALAALHAGQCVVVMNRWEPADALKLIAEHKVTTTHMVPTMFHRLVELPDELKKKTDTSSLTHVIHAAAPCPVPLKHQMIEWWGPVIYEYYAATEGGGTKIDSKEWLAHPGSVGQPWPNSEIHILDDDGNALPAGEVGTVYMKSARAGFEYFKDKDKTSKAKRGELFTVGDMGYLTEDGWLFLCDRKADMIISGGVNIYPAEVEAVLSMHPKVHDVAVFGVPDDDWGERVQAVVEPAPGIAAGDALGEELMSFARERLAKYKLPRKIDFENDLPRQPSGKLYKRLIKERYWKDTGRKI